MKGFGQHARLPPHNRKTPRKPVTPVTGSQPIEDEREGEREWLTIGPDYVLISVNTYDIIRGACLST